MIREFPNTMVINVQRTSRGDEIYIQLRNEDDVLFAEAVSNTYLEGASRLSEQDIRRLGRLGWSAPAGDDYPNYYRDYEVGDAEAVTRHVAQTLRDVYHVNPEADGWLISYTDPPPE